MKSMIGIVLAFALGFSCRAFGIPSPAPPLILGALLVMAMTVGYIAVDRWMASPARHARDCGGPSGLSASPGNPATPPVCPRLRHYRKVRSTERCTALRFTEFGAFA